MKNSEAELFAEAKRMEYTAIIEQTRKYRKRMKYIAVTNSFIEKDCDSLGHARNVYQPYGWIKESGTPPMPHLDVIIMTEREFELGDEVPVTIIGVFWRADGDHKLVGVLPDRKISDISRLAGEEIDALNRLYGTFDGEKWSYKYEGEGWYGGERAEKVLKEFFDIYVSQPRD